MKYCIECKIEKAISEFSNGRNICKECRNKYHKNNRIKNKNADPIMYICRRMAFDAHSRIYAKSREYKTCYKHLIDPFGFENTNELKLFLYENFKDRIKWYLDRNITPSIDRIDSTIGYTKTNIQIIPFKKNTEKGLDTIRRKVEMIDPDGKVHIFPSVIKCANYFGITESKYVTKISSWIKNDGRYKRPNGYDFKYI